MSGSGFHTGTAIPSSPLAPISSSNPRLDSNNPSPMDVDDPGKDLVQPAPDPKSALDPTLAPPCDSTTRPTADPREEKEWDPPTPAERNLIRPVFLFDFAEPRLPRFHLVRTTAPSPSLGRALTDLSSVLQLASILSF